MKDSDAGEGGVNSRDELDVWVPAAVQGKNYTKEIPSLFEMKVQLFEPRHRHQAFNHALGRAFSPFRCNPLPTVIDFSFSRSGPPPSGEQKSRNFDGSLKFEVPTHESPSL